MRKTMEALPPACALIKALRDLPQKEQLAGVTCPDAE